MDRDREQLPEVRFARAQEHYAHAVRMNDSAAKREAEEELSAARGAIAEAADLPDEIRVELENSIGALRARLAESDERLSTDLVDPAARLSLREELDVGRMTAALHGAEPSTAATIMAAAGRRAVEEEGWARMELLGERFADALAEIDRSLAAVKVEHQHAVRRHRDSRWGKKAAFPLAHPSFLAGAILMSLSLLAVAAQAQLANDIFGATLAVAQPTAAMIALSYSLTLGAVAILSGSVLASVRALGPDRWKRRAPVAAALCLPPVLLAGMAASTLGTGWLAASTVGLVGVLFVALCISVGYQNRMPEVVEELSLQHLVQTAQRHASVRAQRYSLLRTYVSRGLVLQAKARRRDALFVYETMQQAPHLGEDMQPVSGQSPQPKWLQDALVDLESEQQFRAGKRRRLDDDKIAEEDQLIH